MPFAVGLWQMHSHHRDRNHWNTYCFCWSRRGQTSRYCDEGSGWGGGWGCGSAVVQEETCVRDPALQQQQQHVYSGYYIMSKLDITIHGIGKFTILKCGSTQYREWYSI